MEKKTSSLPSIVSKDMTITGNIESPGTVQIEGKVVGDINCKDLTLGESGEVHGHVRCDVADIHGTVVGEIEVTKVTVAATAKIKGDIVHENLSIEANARVEGQLKRVDSQESQLNLVSDETA